MVADLQVPGGVTLPSGELSWRFSRSPGPGGQSVNTTDSRVELVFDLAASAALTPTQKERALQRLGGRLAGGVLVVAASEHRSQLRNREAARERLAVLLGAGIAPPPRTRRPTRATRASVERRLSAKKRRSQLKKGRQREQ
ncbi:MAG: alternative ribosome rescue aminoacyl-tRNA hydrolase ArfB [Candidatus Nanopelagicales bacterium]